MKENSRGIYDSFPMQAALGLYRLHRFSEDEDGEEEWGMPYRKKEEKVSCASKKTTSVTTRDTKH